MAIEIWGGVECTVNRVGDEYFDQLEATGHAHRLADLDLFAAAGLRTLRYPVLWERVAPQRLEDADFSWCDVRLARLRELGIEPIAGLVHHGSGPHHTSLLGSDFPEKLAAYARAVAERYPWVKRFTPINEPLTTARFSGLYGHWYPHHSNDESFVRMLWNEVRGTALAMRAIREVTPDAELVQTDDGGHTYSTELLDYQAKFENARRWLSFDMLMGRVDRTHQLWAYLRKNGLTAAELDTLVDEPCPPGVIGLNYYVTSDRYLDHRIERYPEWVRGGNGTHQYADIEAVRVRREGIYGHAALLTEAHRRYRLPIAITEAHLGCTREEQVRWLLESWAGAEAARVAGADVRAVTAWALLGCSDWDSLVTRKAGHYEPGAFDVRGPTPRRTALGSAIRDLANHAQPKNPAVRAQGWWRRPSRLLFPATPQSARHGAHHREGSRPILITGATGTLGRALGRVCAERGLEYRLLRREDMDIASSGSVEAALTRYRPWAVVNAAGFVRVDDAENEQSACFRENTTGPVTLATACNGLGVAFVTFSSDLVFDGRKGEAYVESDRPTPLGVYGRSKAEAEWRVSTAMPRALLLRTSAFFGPWDNHNFVASVLHALAHGQTFRAAHDLVVSPTYVPDLAHAALDLLIDGEHGIWHLANDGALSWADLAILTAQLAGFDEQLIERCSSRELGLRAPRPQTVVLGSERGQTMPTLADAMLRFIMARGKLQAESHGEALRVSS